MMTYWKAHQEIFDSSLCSVFCLIEERRSGFCSFFFFYYFAYPGFECWEGFVGDVFVWFGLPRELPAVEVAKRLGKSAVGMHDKTAHLGLEDNKGPWCALLSSLLLSSSLSLSKKEADVEDSSVAKVLLIEGLDAGKAMSERIIRLCVLG